MRSLALLCRSLPVVVLAGAYALRAFATLESRTLTKLFHTCAYIGYSRSRLTEHRRGTI